jgi:DNA uptake protein ComE-like DNA-binding protein
MNLNTEPIRNWFGFTRRERRSTFIMFVIIIVIIGSRYIIPDSRIAIEDITASVAASDIDTGQKSTDSPIARKHSLSAYNSESKSGYYADNKKIPGNKKEKTGSSVLFSTRKQSNFKEPDDYSSQQRVRIDINASDSATLVRLPGIGPVLSSRIIKYRRLLGGFASIGQLKEVYGLQTETFDIIKDRVFADSSVIKRININTAGFKELSHVHYFEKFEITSIMKYRKLKGRINGLDDLIDNKLITKEKAMSVGPYLKYDE